MSTVETEHVLVVPTQLFHEIGHFQGFSADTQRYMDSLLDPMHTSFRPRSEMEDDPSFKQLIPYVVFRWANSNGEIHVFQYKRGNGQGEKRLHAKRSVGIGGHISSIDASESNVYEEGMRRELEEEVNIRTNYTAQCVGMINDDQTEVGKVHLGVVHVFDCELPEVYPNEDEMHEAKFAPVGELLSELDSFESWSSICLEALFKQSSID